MENRLGEKRKRRIRREEGKLPPPPSPYSHPSLIFFVLTLYYAFPKRLKGFNRPFLSYLKPLFQSEAKFEAIGMKLILARVDLVCVASVSVKGIFDFGRAKNGTRAKKEGMQIKLIFTRKVSHFNSLVLRASVFGTWKWSIVFWLLGKVINGSKKKLSGSTGRNRVQSINC